MKARAEDLPDARLLQIQIALEIAEDLIVDSALPAQPEDGAPLNRQKFVRELPVFLELWTQPVRRAVRRSAERFQHFAIVLSEIVIGAAVLSAIVAARLL